MAKYFQAFLFLFTGISYCVSALDITVSEGYLIQLPSNAKTIFVANPDIANYQVPASDKIFVFGLKPGSTNLYALDAAGSVIFEDKIKVQHDTIELNEQITTLYPEARVKAVSNNGQLLLQGTAPTALVAANIVALSRSYMMFSSEEGEPPEPINQLAVTLPNQVNIRVRIAEVSRSVTTKLGLHPGDDMLGLKNVGWVNHTSNTSELDLNQMMDKVVGVDIAGSLNKIFGLKLNSHSIMLDALAKEGAAKLLAEPNLTSLSGETASFLAGGEYPLPVSQNQNGQILVQYKKYGVLLNITPTVLSDQRISLKIQPEVSSLDVNTGLAVGGLAVPGIKVNRADTTVELASGESFMLAGLLMHDENNTVSKFPFLGDIPVLGALFRSTGFERKETELVIIAEAYVVQPSRDKNLTLPTDNYKPYSDLERLFNMTWQQETVMPALQIDEDQPRLLGDNGFYY
ncbi:type II and III secretion system protein family protein [Pseudoalteromonas denitrificans]|uniref:Pilus assembly protein CpaC n=1 Tax=Pseudoalteromonas denitrificans DSM 6059 TaxID=1123010 RepID=A0A1I1LPS5_9GAMM|nr:type II and III secretion system protein family protein [Pseudoalteromonas denitrificans]SFC74995.1 pilus assembly protein CpaC [Pseudoalteromonas denitrificans DSM 6059]